MLYPQIIRSITNGFSEPGFTGKLARFLDRYTPIQKGITIHPSNDNWNVDTCHVP